MQVSKADDGDVTMEKASQSWYDVNSVSFLSFSPNQPTLAKALDRPKTPADCYYKVAKYTKFACKMLI